MNEPPQVSGLRKSSSTIPGAEVKTAFKQWSQVLGLALSKSPLPSKVLVSVHPARPSDSPKQLHD